MSDAILVLNAGSSSIKFSVFPGHERPNRQDIICDGECEGIGHRVHFTAKDRTGLRWSMSIWQKALHMKTRWPRCCAGWKATFRTINWSRPDIGWCMAGRFIPRRS